MASFPNKALADVFESSNMMSRIEQFIGLRNYLTLTCASPHISRLNEEKYFEEKKDFFYSAQIIKKSSKKKRLWNNPQRLRMLQNSLKVKVPSEWLKELSAEEKRNFLEALPLDLQADFVMHNQEFSRSMAELLRRQRTRDFVLSLMIAGLILPALLFSFYYSMSYRRRPRATDVAVMPILTNTLLMLFYFTLEGAVDFFVQPRLRRAPPAGQPHFVLEFGAETSITDQFRQHRRAILGLCIFAHILLCAVPQSARLLSIKDAPYWAKLFFLIFLPFYAFLIGVLAFDLLKKLVETLPLLGIGAVSTRVEGRGAVQVGVAEPEAQALALVLAPQAERGQQRDPEVQRIEERRPSQP